ncbi:MAG: HDOD domain-containing protein, partial [Gammaproteobacteria bacterium]|nr:HDOD domain-containing protein [Gammaproteobacteria bacterium]
MSSTTQAKASGDPLKGISIPPKPQILVDLHKVGDNTKKIVDLISQDTGVSATVLKTINSPFFGLAKKITSIQQAVLLLGNQSVINIVNSLILRTSLHKDQDENMSEFWDSSMD